MSEMDILTVSWTDLTWKHLAQLTLKKRRNLLQEYRAWNKSMHDELSSEFDGVSETMSLLKAAGMKMANRFDERETIWSMKGIELLDVEGVFDVIIGLDDVTNTKPDPEPILLALERLGAAKEEALDDWG